MADPGDMLGLEEVRDKILTRRDHIKQHDNEQRDLTALVSASKALLCNKRRDYTHDWAHIAQMDEEVDNSALIDKQANVFERQYKARYQKCGQYGCRGDKSCPEAAARHPSDSSRGGGTNQKYRNFDGKRSPGVNTGNS